VTWLQANIGASGVVVLDASMAPIGGAPPPSPAETRYIPGARVFDFDRRICDRASPLPHMMPSAELFEAELRALGVNRDSQVVVYDKVGIFSSPRAWWMLRSMGHHAVAVLDGGLPAWIAAGLPTENTATAPSVPGDFVARPQPGYFCDADRVAQVLGSAGQRVLDARSEGRFKGSEPEPRQGLRAGHMPGAVNLPFSAVQREGRMLPPEELRQLYASKVGARDQLVFSCGSGVTACVLALGATLAGHSQLSVYDGSWSEWGLPSSRPVVSG
jgi:thiosulfate/3-mercaptopyruvate sulfurtransferase